MPIIKMYKNIGKSNEFVSNFSLFLKKSFIKKAKPHSPEIIPIVAVEANVNDINNIVIKKSIKWSICAKRVLFFVIL